MASGLLQDAAKWSFFPPGGGATDKRYPWEAAMRSIGLGWAQVQVEPVPGSAPVSGSGSGLVSVGLMEVVGSASH